MHRQAAWAVRLYQHNLCPASHASLLDCDFAASIACELRCVCLCMRPLRDRSIALRKLNKRQKKKADEAADGGAKKKKK